ncbi:MAG: N-acetylglutaminylglutamine synthetase [Desulforhopalus sp.]
MKDRPEKCKNPFDPNCMSSLKHWGKPPKYDPAETMRRETRVDCGWGRLIFGQTFEDPSILAESIMGEQKGSRDIAMYVREPHVVLSYAPQNLFIDPSLTYRLDFQNYRDTSHRVANLTIRPLTSCDDEMAINTIYQSWGMVPSYKGFYKKTAKDIHLLVLIAEESDTGTIVGAITGVDHYLAFNDPDNGSSLWALAVDQQCKIPKVGEALVRELILQLMERGRRFIDLSVMHTNGEAISLYDKLGFEQVPVYCIKKKNSINEPLYLGPDTDHSLNIYAKIITSEAKKRGIGVDVIDAENGYFRLSLGGRSLVCRESLSELTTAVAMSRCDDKTVTRKILKNADLRVPDQQVVTDQASIDTFLARNSRIVVKPAQGEQGQGVFVDLERPGEIRAAVDKASQLCDKVIMEEFVEGEDLRIIVIDNQVVAAAVRKPASIQGNGLLTIRELIEKQSRRRAAATHGESTIPLDAETERTIIKAKYTLTDILPEGTRLFVRKTANLHTGGTIQDVTSKLHPTLREAAKSGAQALQIPVVGFDFLVPDLEGPDYVIIEANERPGLANHEPQPTAEKFIDLLFPQSRHI